MDSAALDNKPICYLDVDDTLIVGTVFHYADSYRAEAIGRARMFFEFLEHYFEIRWLTGWAIHGELEFSSARKLATMLGLYNGTERLMKIKNPLSIKFDPFQPQGLCKTVAIDFDSNFIWVQEEIYNHDIKVLTEKNAMDKFIECNISAQLGAFDEAQKKIFLKFPEIAKDKNVSKFIYR